MSRSLTPVFHDSCWLKSYEPVERPHHYQDANRVHGGGYRRNFDAMYEYYRFRHLVSLGHARNIEISLPFPFRLCKGIVGARSPAWRTDRI